MSVRKDKTETVIEEAARLTSTDRQAVYGHPAIDFERVARLAAPILESDMDPRLKHALYMVQVKIARLLNTPDHRDSIVDGIGYFNTYSMILEKDEIDHMEIARLMTGCSS